MDFAKVIVKSNKKEVDKIKELLKKLKDHNPNMVMSALRYGELGGELLVSFNIDHGHHELVLSKLMLNSMDVWPHDNDTKELMDKIKKTQVTGMASLNRGSGWDDLRKKNADEAPEETGQRLEKLVQAGKYEEVIKLAKDFRNKAIADLAKERLPDAVSIAVDRLAALALTKKYEADKVIKTLLSIGSDQTINSLGKPELSEKAGMAAISICDNYKDFTWDLMKIITDNKQSKVVNLRAAARFSAKIFEDPETYNVELENAAKNVNVRWLQINYDVVEHILSSDEKAHIDKLIDFVRGRRA
ncbi:MAG: hypothetical protein KKA84_04595 [Bacteroidetes bacterium]|nr:hypothetical protein [Bacteroidota bacterium]